MSFRAALIGDEGVTRGTTLIAGVVRVCGPFRRASGPYFVVLLNNLLPILRRF
jgi:hypothetical protein